MAAALIAGEGTIFLDVGIYISGMMTIYAENLLGIRYRYKNRKGEWVGGAMVYIERDLGVNGLPCFLLYSVFLHHLEWEI